jgi:hypothetical protein
MTANPEENITPITEIPLHKSLDLSYEGAVARRHAGVALLLSSTALASSREAMGLRASIYEIDNDDTLTQREVLFQNICNSALNAFPSTNPSDAEILASSATPALVRYVLASFRRYGDNPKNLATAFKLKQQRRGPTGTFKELRVAMLTAAGHAIHKALVEGHALTEARQFAIDAAYKRYREGNDNEQDESDRRRILKKIQELMNKELGFL